MAGVFVDGLRSHILAIDAVVELQPGGKIELAIGDNPLTMSAAEAEELIQTLIDAVRTQHPHKRLTLFL